MKKICTALGLLWLLLVAQQGALLHEISHFSQIGSQDISVHGDHATASACELCLAYAQLGHPTGHSFYTPPIILAAPEQPSEPGYSATTSPVPTPRSRGPPATT